MKLTEQLIEIGAALASAQGHIVGCPFTGCTCGSVLERKDLTREFWKLHREYRGEV